MIRVITFITLLCSLPFVASAATFAGGDTIVTTTPFSGNLYETGSTIRLGIEAPADVVFAGGTLTLAAPVLGDVLLFGGTVDIQQEVIGDARILGGRVVINKPIKGDLLFAGGSVEAFDSVPETYGVGSSIALNDGADGAVHLYGGTVYLSGEFAGDVDITVSDKLVLAPDTYIAGSLNYNAPQEVLIPQGARILGGVSYTGSSSFVPSPEEAQNVARAGMGIFLLVKIVAALVVTGLVVGLFPTFATHLSKEVLGRGVRHFALLFFLGFAIAFATPVLILLLLVSFVGIGIAALLAVLYLLALLLAGCYAGSTTGSAVARTFWKRETVSWKDALLGTLLLTSVSLIPLIGGLFVFILAMVALGVLVRSVYLFAFGRNQEYREPF